MIIYLFNFLVSDSVMTEDIANKDIEIPSPSEHLIINASTKSEHSSGKPKHNSRKKRNSKKLAPVVITQVNPHSAHNILKKNNVSNTEDSSIKLPMSKNLEKILEKNQINFPNDLSKKKVDVIVETDTKEKAEKTDNTPKDTSRSKEKIIIFKEMNKSIAKNDPEPAPEPSIPFSEYMFSSTIKTKEEILRKKDSIRLIENNMKLNKLISQLKVISKENEKILQMFKETDEFKKDEEETKPMVVKNIKVIEVEQK